MYTDHTLLEKKIISKINRFNINNKQNIELKKLFKGQNLLIYGAAGSIGSVFTLNILKYNFKKIYLLDKNENQLVELNRSIILKNKKKNDMIEYICSDINKFKLNSFLREKKINIFLNFAAIKHVRSEENDYTLNYMFETNCKSCFEFKPAKFLKKVFFISTDKACNPSSIMGASKNLMEQELFNKKKSYNRVFFSTVRFANVSFSNGSVLKMIIDKIESKEDFGVPENIYRYFITHQEAVSLCMKSLLNAADGMVLVPRKSILKDQLSIVLLLKKILKIHKIKYRVSKKKFITKYFKVNLTKNKIIGQKEKEELFNKSEIKKNNQT